MFGVNSDPKKFQCFRRNVSNCLNYLDDIIAFELTEEAYDRCFNKVLDTLKIITVLLN